MADTHTPRAATSIKSISPIYGRPLAQAIKPARQIWRAKHGETVANDLSCARDLTNSVVSFSLFPNVPTRQPVPIPVEVVDAEGGVVRVVVDTSKLDAGAWGWSTVAISDGQSSICYTGTLYIEAE